MLEKVAASMRYGSAFYTMMMKSLQGAKESNWIYANSTVISRFTELYEDHLEAFDGLVYVHS